MLEQKEEKACATPESWGEGASQSQAVQELQVLGDDITRDRGHQELFRHLKETVQDVN